MNEIIELKGLDLLREEVKKELDEYVVIKVEDDKTYKLAKKERANLNKLKKAVDTERKRLAKELKSKVDSIIELVDKPINELDTQTKAYDDILKQDRYKEIETYFNTLNSPIEFERVYDEKWLNKTAEWEKELNYKVDGVKRDLEIIKMITTDKKFEELYWTCLDITETKRLYELQQPKEKKEYTLTFTCDNDTYLKIKSYVESLTNE